MPRRTDSEPLLGREIADRLRQLARDAIKMACATEHPQELDLAGTLRLLAAYADRGHVR